MEGKKMAMRETVNGITYKTGGRYKYIYKIDWSSGRTIGKHLLDERAKKEIQDFDYDPYDNMKTFIFMREMYERLEWEEEIKR
jgi:hypothetical protein